MSEGPVLSTAHMCHGVRSAQSHVSRPHCTHVSRTHVLRHVHTCHVTRTHVSLTRTHGHGVRSAQCAARCFLESCFPSARYPCSIPRSAQCAARARPLRPTHAALSNPYTVSSCAHTLCKGTSPIRNSAPLGPYRRAMPRALKGL